MNKKDNEKVYLDQFLEIAKFDDCEIIEDEAPDFGLHFKKSGKKIGIEITNLFVDNSKKGSMKKSEEVKRYNFLNELAHRYYKEFDTPIKVQILSRFDVNYNNNILNKILSHLKISNSLTIWENHSIEINLPNNNQLKIWILRLPKKFRNFSNWTIINSHVGVVSPIDFNDIQLPLKEKKLPRYLEKYPEIILLIVADKSAISGFFKLPKKPIEGIKTGFAEIYCMIYPDQVIKIK